MDLVIFDCDGVLVDSEVIVVETESELLTDAGFPMTVDEIAERCIGLAYRDMIAMLEHESGRPVPRELSERIRQRTLAALHRRLEPVRDIANLLAELTVARCVASGSELDRVRLCLELTDLSQFFDPRHVFSRQMVPHGKPAPDLFLHAAEQVGVDPDRCLVVEDSPHGVIAGVAAGMHVVGFVGGRHARPSLRRRLQAAGAPAVAETSTQLADEIADRT